VSYSLFVNPAWCRMEMCDGVPASPSGCRSKPRLRHTAGRV